MKKNITVFVGIDGVNRRYIERILNRSKFFKSVADNGSFLDVKTLVPTISPSAWNSMFTGCDPTCHGVFNFFDLKTDRVITKDKIKAPVLWEFLDAYGKKYCIIGNICYYSKSFKEGNGFVIPTPIFLVKNPEESVESIIPSKIGEHDARKIRRLLISLYKINKKIYSVNKSYRLHFDRWRVLKYIFESAKIKVLIALELNRILDLEFLAVIFNETDVVQHFFYDKKEIMDKFMIYLDSILDEMIREISKTKNIAYTFVASDHGFYESPRRAISLEFLKLYANGILRRTAKRITVETMLDNLRYIAYNAPIIKYMFILEPQPLKTTMKTLRNLISKKTNTKKRGKNKSWKINSYGFVYTEGKENREKLKKTAIIMDKLKIDNEKIFNDVKIENIGESETLLLFRINEKYKVYYQKFFRTIPIIHNTPINKGDHFAGPPGIFMVSRPNKKIQLDMKEISIKQITPIILSAIKLPIPTYMIDKNEKTLKLVEKFGDVKTLAARNPRDVKKQLKILKIRKRLLGKSKKK